MIKVRRIFRALERSQSRADVEGILRSPETRELAIDAIASEHRLPRVAARWICQMLAARLDSRLSNDSVK